jgi:carboxypeptidase Q
MPAALRILIPILLPFVVAAACAAVASSFRWTQRTASSAAEPAASDRWIDPYREPAQHLIREALSNRFAWERLALVTDMFGHRLSGSEALESAIAWALAEMKKDGLENVRAEPVKVPHWVRGRESAEIVAPHRSELSMLGLGNSIGTPAEGVEAEVVVVRSFQELDRARDRVKGRIVLFNVPFTTYGATVPYRGSGPSRAAALGAVAALVRSVGPPGLRTPHTGALQYTDGRPQIPAAAISAEDADRLQRMQDRGTAVRVRLRMEAKFLPDADSANVVAEITGRERPREVVVVSGHFDSWDVGTGASDDAGGCIVAWEALRLLKALNLRPRRTVRVVLFTNEENGLRGGLAYLDRYRAELPDHVMMLESDEGLLQPARFGFSGSASARTRVQEIATLLRGIGMDRIGASGGGADIGPSVEAGNIPAMSLEGEGDYFRIHHTQADTVDKIDPEDVARAAAAVAVMAYVIAEMPERLR